MSPQSPGDSRVRCMLHTEAAHPLPGCTGLATAVEERMMDAVTALSGSGPAYVFLILEALTDGAVATGLPREQALALATQMVIGSARWVSDSGSLVVSAAEVACAAVCAVWRTADLLVVFLAALRPVMATSYVCQLGRIVVV